MVIRGFDGAKDIRMDGSTGRFYLDWKGLKKRTKSSDKGSK
jgi:hypothetical protein